MLTRIDWEMCVIVWTNQDGLTIIVKNWMLRVIWNLWLAKTRLHCTHNFLNNLYVHNIKFNVLWDILYKTTNILTWPRISIKNLVKLRNDKILSEFITPNLFVNLFIYSRFVLTQVEITFLVTKQTFQIIQ